MKTTTKIAVSFIGGCVTLLLIANMPIGGNSLLTHDGTIPIPPSGFMSHGSSNQAAYYVTSDGAQHAIASETFVTNAITANTTPVANLVQATNAVMFGNLPTINGVPVLTNAPAGSGVTNVVAGHGIRIREGSPQATNATFDIQHAPNWQTGTSYTVTTNDWGKWVVFSNTSSVAVTLPLFEANFFVFIQNQGAGLVTVTPTACNINGTSSADYEQLQGGMVSSDGTNYNHLRFSMRSTSGGIPYGSTAAGGLKFSSALTQHGVVMGGGAGGSPTSSTAGTAGQVFTSNGAADGSYQNIWFVPSLRTANYGKNMMRWSSIPLQSATTLSTFGQNLSFYSSTTFQGVSATEPMYLPATTTAATTRFGYVDNNTLIWDGRDFEIFNYFSLYDSTGTPEDFRYWAGYPKVGAYSTDTPTQGAAWRWSAGVDTYWTAWYNDANGSSGAVASTVAPASGTPILLGVKKVGTALSFYITSGGVTTTLGPYTYNPATPIVLAAYCIGYTGAGAVNTRGMHFYFAEGAYGMP